MYSMKFQILLFFCCLLVIFGCLLFVPTSPRRWIANIRLQDLQDYEEDVNRGIQSNIESLTQLLQYRLSLPDDAPKISNSSLCTEHEKDFRPCLKENCTELSSKPLRKRIEELVLAPHFHLDEQQLQNILSFTSNVSEEDVIIASASSANHFKEMEAMFAALHKTVYPDLKNFKVILFDIGLKKRQKRLTEKYCKCQVLSFPFKLFPPHVSNPLCYSWKAIIIRALISKARKLLIWQDSTVRWSKKFHTILQRAMQYGQQLTESPSAARITAHTLPQMFDYMGEDECHYFMYREIQAGFQVLKNDPLVIQAVLNPWTRCALEKSCMCPVDPQTVIRCSKELPKCHRFDQSAMSIIMSKLYAADRNRFLVPFYSKTNSTYVSVQRGDKQDKWRTLD
ncbi:hypothetical protein EGW08_000664 [Elysia chlorotica]|uniref:Uncharacterized protein n=1 Tax=Elysia chlorotica TaxID=188477 RepID=A0A3S1BM90_ELYCH|nr:hypothetical protein EGW08_000664 [Elysia chlorotica]